MPGLSESETIAFALNRALRKRKIRNVMYFQQTDIFCLTPLAQSHSFMLYYSSFRLKRDSAALAQSVEHFLGKEEVVGPIPMGGSILAEAETKKTRTTHRSTRNG